ncbi:hypothetical protein [Nocardioides sp.]|uniref:DUF7507 domain-containing protein n=1 Tax=Nocardioides sp. TaxID=35761 RepID=UPI0035130EF4
MRVSRFPTSAPIGVALALGLVAAATTAVTVQSVSPATAAPGSPGTPSAPEVLVAEDFQQGRTPGQVSTLPAYRGGVYTADPAWLDTSSGNGLLLDGTSSDADLVTAGFTAAPTAAGPTTQGGRLRQLAIALGVLNGTPDPADNVAVTAYSNSAPGAGKVEWATVNPLSLNADGRFLTVSANVAVVNCVVAANDPLLKFYLVDGTTERAVNDVALNPCPPAGGTDDATATTLRGGNAVLFDGDQVGVLMRNEQGSGSGNDHAYDDITVLDVTPQLDKEFVAPRGPLYPGTPIDLVFTVTNTSELGEKVGWELTDSLSRDLAVAGTPSTDCAAATIDAVPGASRIAVTGGTIGEGVASCTITVPVTADGTGTFRNSASNIASRGLRSPGATSVTFVAPPVPADPSLRLVKKADRTRITAVGQVVRYRFRITNDGNVPVRQVGVSEISFSGRGTLSTPRCPRQQARVLKPGDSVVCTARYRVVAADLRTRTLRNTARATGIAQGGTFLRSPSSVAAVPVRPLPTPPNTGA